MRFLSSFQAHEVAPVCLQMSLAAVPAWHQAAMVAAPGQEEEEEAMVEPLPTNMAGSSQLMGPTLAHSKATSVQVKFSPACFLYLGHCLSIGELWPFQCRVSPVKEAVATPSRVTYPQHAHRMSDEVNRHEGLCVI